MNWYKKAQNEPEYTFDPEPREYKQLTPSKWQPINSKWIAEVAYYGNLGYLDVRLKNGQKYTFKNVPKNIYLDFMKAKSKGKYFNKVLKPKFTE